VRSRISFVQSNFLVLLFGVSALGNGAVARLLAQPNTHVVPAMWARVISMARHDVWLRLQHILRLFSQPVQNHAEKRRVLRIGQPADGLPDNRVSNTKYTALTFLPLFLLEQFGTPMNLYFLMIAFLQLWRAITPVNPITTWAPLLFVLAVSGVKEVLEDRRRAAADQAANSRRFVVYRQGTRFDACLSMHIHVGDVVQVSDDEEMPCDLLLLHTVAHSENGSAFVETANLDGETDLKTRVSRPETQALSLEQLTGFGASPGDSVLAGQVTCEPPNADLYRFDASFTVRLPSAHEPTCLSVSAHQLLQHGTILRKTGSVIGVAVYTGPDTKLNQNRVAGPGGATSRAADRGSGRGLRSWLARLRGCRGRPSKRSVVDSTINRFVVLVFIAQLVLVAVFGIFGQVFSGGPGSADGRWYLAWPVETVVSHGDHQDVYVPVDVDDPEYAWAAGLAANGSAAADAAFSRAQGGPQLWAAGGFGVDAERRWRDAVAGAAGPSPLLDAAAADHVHARATVAPGMFLARDRHGHVRHRSLRSSPADGTPLPSAAVVGGLESSGVEVPLAGPRVLQQHLAAASASGARLHSHRQGHGAGAAGVGDANTAGGGGDPVVVQPWYTPFILPLRFLLLSSMMIPISLKVSLDLLKVVYGRLIGADADMYDEASDTPAAASNTGITEDLGRVQYVLTDKTGTLTENRMVTAAFGVRGRLCAIDPTLVADPGGSDVGAGVEPDPPAARLFRIAGSGDPQVLDFLRAVALCNTVEPELLVAAQLAGAAVPSRPAGTRSGRLAEQRESDSDDESATAPLATTVSVAPVASTWALQNPVGPLRAGPALDPEPVPTSVAYRYVSSSPDEEALVGSAAAAGVCLTGRRHDRTGRQRVTLSVSRPSSAAFATAQCRSPSAAAGVTMEHQPGASACVGETYEVLHVLEFTSARKCMSVLLRRVDVGEGRGTPVAGPPGSGAAAALAGGGGSAAESRATPPPPTAQPARSRSGPSFAHPATAEPLLPASHQLSYSSHHTHTSRGAPDGSPSVTRPPSRPNSVGADLASAYTASAFAIVDASQSEPGPSLRYSAGTAAYSGLCGDELILITKGADEVLQSLLTPLPPSAPFPADSSSSVAIAHRRSASARPGQSSTGRDGGAGDGSAAEAVARRRTWAQLRALAGRGLRTLVVAGRTVSTAEYAAWLPQWEHAHREVHDRASAVARAAAALERGLLLLGCTAIEDALQEGVPDTVAALRQAGMRVWMLTGDKAETAVQIARSCNLLAHQGAAAAAAGSAAVAPANSASGPVGGVTAAHMTGGPAASQRQQASGAAATPESVFVLKAGSELELSKQLRQLAGRLRLEHALQGRSGPRPRPEGSSAAAPAMGSPTAGLLVAAESGEATLTPSHPNGEASQPASHADADTGTPPLTLVVDGIQTIRLVLHAEYAPAFLLLAEACESVLCCRCLPMQKAALVSLLRSAGRVTLAIGDGGNDVSMIQAAHVGVGLAGREGRHAARAADFSFARFWALRRLLLVHGHLAHYRTSLVAQYTFYKSMCIGFVQLGFNAWCAFSGCSLLDSFALTTYNLVYTFVPAVLLVLDATQAQHTLMAEPQRYAASQSGAFLSPVTFFCWCARAVCQSALLLVTFAAGVAAAAGAPAGDTMDQGTLSYGVFSTLVVLQLITIAASMRRPTTVNVVACGAFFLLYLALLAFRDAATGERVLVAVFTPWRPLFWTMCLAGLGCSIGWLIPVPGASRLRGAVAGVCTMLLPPQQSWPQHPTAASDGKTLELDRGTSTGFLRPAAPSRTPRDPSAERSGASASKRRHSDSSDEVESEEVCPAGVATPGATAAPRHHRMRTGGGLDGLGGRYTAVPTAEDV